MVVQYPVDTVATNGPASMKTVHSIGSFAHFIVAFNNAAYHRQNH